MKRKGWQSWTIVAVPMVVLALTATGCGDDDGGCTDECDFEGAAQCGGTVIQFCTRGTEECLGWVDSVDCAENMQICDDSTGNPVCVSDCSDQCDVEGATQCNGTNIESCLPLSNDCLDWQLTQNCADTDDLCDETGGSAICVVDCTIATIGTPAGPVPADGSAGVDVTVTTGLNWDDAENAASYAYYLGTCPAPAYPDAAYSSVAVSETSGLSFTANTTYCWQVVSIDSDGCLEQGPSWTFDTDSCADPVTGAPTVTSALAQGITAPTGTYTLTFSEDVNNVATSLTLTATVGTGTLGTVIAVDARTYTVELNGLAAGDDYTLTVGAAVADVCGNPLSAPLDISLTIVGADGEDCTNPTTTTSGNHTVDGNGHDCWTFAADAANTANDHSFSCDSAVGGDQVIEYTTGPGDTAIYWDATISNAPADGYIGIEILEADCQTGISLHCASISGTLTDAAGYPAQPSTTYYIWVTDGYSGHSLPDISACIWSDSSCPDPVPGAPLVTSPLTAMLQPGTTGTYTLTFNEGVTGVDMTSLTLSPITGTGTIASITDVTTSSYDVNLTGIAGGDSYTLTVGATIVDGCGTAMTAPVVITIDADPLLAGGTCSDAATVGAAYHSVDVNGHDCWSFPGSTTDTINDHVFTCDSGVGGDAVIEYTTGPTETALYFDVSISNYQTSGYIRAEVVGLDCATGSSLYCTASSSSATDVGAVPVTPNTTYYLWVVDGFSGNNRPDIDACLWSDNACIDLVVGPPQVTSPLTDTIPIGSGTFQIVFNQDAFGVDLTNVTWTSAAGTGTLDSITPVGVGVFDVAYSGAASGDTYTLTISAAVTDGCGDPMPAPVDIQLMVPICGDGIVSDGEACDDGGTTPGDGCDASCLWEIATTPIAAPGASLSLAGSIDATDPTWNRPYSTCSANSTSGYHYDLFAIENTSGAAQTVTITATWAADGYLHLYDEPFIPGDLGTCLIGNDDFNGTGQSQIASYVIPAGETYVIVASTFSSGATIGAYTIVVDTL